MSHHTVKVQHLGEWHNQPLGGERIWRGPWVRIAAGPVVIELQALFVADEGTTVALDTFDHPIPAHLVPIVTAELKRLASLTPPEPAPVPDEDLPAITRRSLKAAGW